MISNMKILCRCPNKDL